MTFMGLSKCEPAASVVPGLSYSTAPQKTASPESAKGTQGTSIPQSRLRLMALEVTFIISLPVSFFS